MGKASKIVTLALLGTGVGYAGYSMLSDDEDDYYSDGTTQPYHRTGSSSHSSWGRSFFHSSSSSSSGSSFHSGTSRGGFGSVGHSGGSSS
jgi:hypothetical protein